MKKLLSFVIFTALLIWTWSVVHTTSNTGFETHAGIQDKLSALIVELIQTKKPQVSDLTIQKMITESLADDKVKAHFTYSFKEAQDGGEVSEQVIRGEAVLQRETAENAGEDRWVVQSVKTTNDMITFVEGTVIGPETIQPTVEKTETTEAPTEKAPESKE